MEGAERKRIGEILVERGYVTRVQVSQARRRQLVSGPEGISLLGEVLWQLGFVSSAQIEEALRIQEEIPNQRGKAPKNKPSQKQ